MSTAGTIYEALRDKGRNGGALRYVGTKALSYLPFNGDKLKINGIWCNIPTSGIAGLGNSASCFVNGTAAQALAANTFYYVYAFMNSATLTADFSTTAHSTSMTAGNVGVEIKTGDDTRSLIGMVRTDASANFLDTVTDRMVRTWFNRSAQQRDFHNAYTALRATVSTTPIELYPEIRSRFLIWKDEIVYATVTGSGYTGGDGGSCYWQIGWDGSPTDVYHATGFSDSPINYSMNTMFADSKSGSTFGAENTWHYVTLMAWTTMAVYMNSLTSVRGCIMGGE